jgi:hypothetical protein
MRRKHISIIAAIPVLTAVNFIDTKASPEGEEGLKAAEQKLTGGTSRDWVFKQMRRTMGASDACQGNGEIYRFTADHKLIDEQCVDGHVKDQTHSWTLEKAEPLDLILKIDGKPFILLLKDESNGLSMRIRQRSESKTIPTIDKELRFETE